LDELLMTETPAHAGHGQLFALLGATASGKSDVAVAVARQRIAQGRPTEIVAIDAFTVYRGMDIATAKPSVAIRKEIPHHMIDVYTPDCEVTVAAFQHDARTVIDSRCKAGVDLILVGGSGLYWRAVVDNLRFPPTDAAVRESLQARFPTNEAAYQQLVDSDPKAAAQIALNNYRRVIRALEVGELTGESFATFHTQWEDFESRYTHLKVGYLAPDVALLNTAIAARSHAMVAAGLLDEARRLRDTWELSRTARQGIGYAEAFAVLDGAAPLEGLAEAIAVRTRQYARRQRSWFRADPRCVPTAKETLVSQWCDLNAVSQT